MFISTKTGTKPQYKTAAAVALKVMAGTNTFFSFLKLLHKRARCKAAVHEFTAILCLTLKYSLHSASNFCTSVP